MYALSDWLAVLAGVLFAFVGMIAFLLLFGAAVGVWFYLRR